MFDDPKGPIEQFSWGKFVVCGAEHSGGGVAGRKGVGKDIRLVGQDVTEWHERQGHRLTSSMITGVYDRGIEVLIIGVGVNGALECPDEVKHRIEAKGISRVILARTPDACALYNSLYRQGTRVALLAHATC